MKTTLFKYIFKMQLKTMLFVSFFVFCLILLFDFAEVTRKFPISSLEQTLFAIKLSFLRTPNTFFEILHYMYFITATLSMWHLISSNQITILKSVGRSPQQILYPFIIFASCLSFCWLFIFHPLGNYTEEAYNTLAGSGQIDRNENVWVDSSDTDNHLIFIRQISGNKIDGFYLFDTLGNKRIFAQNAVVEKDRWALSDVKVVDCKLNTTKNLDTFSIRNKVSHHLIDLLSKSPRKQSIYTLYNIYRIQKENSVSLALYEFELHSLLANCAHFILFALIAAAICLPINRYKTRTSLAMQIIIIAVILRFFNSMLGSLMHTGILNAVLAAWAVVLTAMFITIGVLVWKEV